MTAEPADESRPDLYLVPESDCPPELANWLHQEHGPGQETMAAGFLPRTQPGAASGSGPRGQPGTGRTSSGFESGGPLDTGAPDAFLAGLADAVTRDGHLAELGDDELVGVLRTWRRLASWCESGVLTAVAELARRRPAPKTPPAPPGEFPEQISEFTVDEVAYALTLTSRAADSLFGTALDLATRLPATARALHEGLIDSRRAQVIADLTRNLSDEDAAQVESLIFPKAADQTSGQLRAALAHAVIAVDPGAAARRREEAQKDPRVRQWQEDAGTAALAGYSLPPAEALAADQRLTGRAHALRAAGLPGTLQALRARAYLDALLDRDSTPAAPLTAAPAPSPSGPGSPGSTGGPGSPGSPGDPDVPGPRLARGPGPGPAAGPAPPIASRVTLTLPLDTGTGHSNAPGTVAGYGPVDGPLARQLLAAAGAHPATRFCLTLTGKDGQAIGHACLPGPHAWQKLIAGRLTASITPLARGSCDHRHQEPGYEPSRRLQHLIQARNRTCTARGCQQPAAHCDLDHTKPYDQGGRTCECGLAPLCRHHHRCKQSQGWRLEHPQPGVLAWTTPAGRHYITQPDTYL